MTNKVNPLDARIRAVAIVPHLEQLLLIQRRQGGQDFFVLPGGGVEDDESVESAVIREVTEETSLGVVIEKMIYRHVYDNGQEQHYYLCRFVSGEPRLGEGNELKDMRANPAVLYRPIWLPIHRLGQTLLYPLEIRDWIIEDYSTGWPRHPRVRRYRIAELKKAFYPYGHHSA